jgi:hypothetical protein
VGIGVPPKQLRGKGAGSGGTLGEGRLLAEPPLEEAGSFALRRRPRDKRRHLKIVRRVEKWPSVFVAAIVAVTEQGSRRPFA